MTDNHGNDTDADDPGIEAIARANRSIFVAPLDGVRFVRAARARRRRNRTIISSVLVAAVAVAGVSVATAGGSPNPDNSVDAADPFDAPSTEPTRETQTLTVVVRPLDELASYAIPLTKGSALWLEREQQLLLLPETTYNACLTDSTATVTRGAVSLSLTPPSPGVGVVCADFASRAEVTIIGLTEAPTELTVTEDGETNTVPLFSAPGVVLLSALAPSNDTRTARISGPLNLQGDCVSVGKSVALWPYGTMVISESPLQIRVPGAGVFTEGEVVTGPGGFFDAARDDVLARIPYSCGTTRGTTINPQLN